MTFRKITYESLKTSSLDFNEFLERSSDDSSNSISVRQYTTSSRWTRWKRLFWIFCIIMLVISNGVWVSLYNYQRGIQVINSYPIRVPYHFTTLFSDDNLTRTNQLWAELFPLGGGAIVVDYEWIAANNFPVAKENSTDGRAIYIITAFHQLHCLAVLRTSLYQYKNERKQITSWSHIIHCLDTLRQLIMCSADPTIAGAGVNHECRDWDTLKQWTEKRAFLEQLDTSYITPQPENDI